MYEYIKGKFSEITPAYVVIETNGIGYLINISVSSFSQIQNKTEGILFLHQVVREDAHILYGFSGKQEREVFRKLISVSGVGANTARMILSSMTPADVCTAIVSGDVEKLKSIKGIGAKSAQRIIIDLRDKISSDAEKSEIFLPADNTLKDEALSALETLGFAKKQSEKIIIRILFPIDIP